MYLRFESNSFTRGTGLLFYNATIMNLRFESILYLRETALLF